MKVLLCSERGLNTETNLCTIFSVHPLWRIFAPNFGCAFAMGWSICHCRQTFVPAVEMVDLTAPRIFISAHRRFCILLFFQFFLLTIRSSRQGNRQQKFSERNPSQDENNIFLPPQFLGVDGDFGTF